MDSTNYVISLLRVQVAASPQVLPTADRKKPLLVLVAMIREFENSEDIPFTKLYVKLNRIYPPPPQFLSLFFGGGGGQERFTKCALLTFFPDFPGFLQSRSTRVEWSSSHLLPWLPSAHEAPPGEHNDRKAKGEKRDLQQEWQSSKLKPRIPKPVFVSQSNK